MTTQTNTREQQLATEIAQGRTRHPMLDDAWWQGMERERRLQWQVDDLRNGIAVLVGRYGYHAEQNPENTLLAQLVSDLAELSGVSADGGEKQS